MKKLIIAASFLLLLQGCGTVQFNPPVHTLADTAIPDFPVAGDVDIINTQESTEPTIIHSYGGTKYESNYKTITDTMVEQAKSELAKHGDFRRKGADKTIGLSVTHLNSRYVAFFWKGTMTFTVTLGNEESFDLTVEHGTGAGAAQDLSGSIADGVVALFTNDKVKVYLAR